MLERSLDSLFSYSKSIFHIVMEFDDIAVPKNFFTYLKNYLLISLIRSFIRVTHSRLRQ